MILKSMVQRCPMLNASHVTINHGWMTWEVGCIYTKKSIDNCCVLKHPAIVKLPQSSWVAKFKQIQLNNFKQQLLQMAKYRSTTSTSPLLPITLMITRHLICSLTNTCEASYHRRLHSISTMIVSESTELELSDTAAQTNLCVSWKIFPFNPVCHQRRLRSSSHKTNALSSVYLLCNSRVAMEH